MAATLMAGNLLRLSRRMVISTHGYRRAIGLDTGKLTITFAVGASLFEKEGVDRFGLRSRKPCWTHGNADFP